MAEDKIIYRLELDDNQMQAELVELHKRINELTQANKDLKKSNKENTDEFVKNKEELKKTKKEYNDLSKQIQHSSNLTEKQVGHLTKLKSELHLVTKQINNLTKEELENEKVGGKLIKKQKQLTDELKKYEKAGGNATRNVGNYSSTMEGLPNILGNVVSGIKSMGAALLVNPLTATIAGIAALTTGMVKLFGATNEYNKSVSKTATMFGVAREEAERYKATIDGITAAFDVEYGDVMKSAKALTYEFGITADEALSLINEGFEKGANVNGEFLELLKEYPAQLKQVGLSASQTIAIITQTENMGIFSDKGIDAIKEAGLRLREMTKATKDAVKGIGIDADKLQRDLGNGTITQYQAIQKISEAMSKLGANSNEVGAAVADIFGGPGEDAGLKFLTSLKDINTNLNGLKTSLSESEIASNNLSKAWTKFKDNMLGEAGSMTGFLTDLYNGIANIIDRLSYYSSENQEMAHQTEGLIQALSKNELSMVQMQEKRNELLREEQKIKDIIRANDGVMSAEQQQYLQILHEGIDALTQQIKLEKKRAKEAEKANDAENGGGNGDKKGLSDLEIAKINYREKLKYIRLNVKDSQLAAREKAVAEIEYYRKVLEIQKTLAKENKIINADEIKQIEKTERKVDELLEKLKNLNSGTTIPSRNAEKLAVNAGSTTDIQNTNNVGTGMVEGTALGYSDEYSGFYTQEELSELENMKLETQQMGIEASKELYSEFRDWRNQMYEEEVAALQEKTNKELEIIQSKYDNEIALLDKKHKEGLISDIEYNRKITMVTREKESEERKIKLESAQKEKELKKQQLEEQKKFQIAEVLINLASAAIKIWNNTIPYPAGAAYAAIQSAIVTAMAMAQIGMIQSQHLASGGVLQGNLHRNGGIKLAMGAEIEGGEYVVNRAATQAYKPALDFINQAGNQYGNNDDVTPIIDYDLLSEKIGSAVNDKKVVIVNKDLDDNNTTNTLIKNKTTF